MVEEQQQEDQQNQSTYIINTTTEIVSVLLEKLNLPNSNLNNNLKVGSSLTSSVFNKNNRVDHQITTTDSSPIHQSHHMLVIDSIVNYYHYHENDTVFATPGTELTYSCSNDDYILVGKEVRKCRSDRTWTGNEPICKCKFVYSKATYIKSLIFTFTLLLVIKSTNELIESSNTLLIVIVVMGILLFVIITVSCILFVMYTKRLKKKSEELKAEKTNVNNLYNEYNLYDNIELNQSDNYGISSGKLFHGEDGFYEVYERIDDPFSNNGNENSNNGNEYTPYNHDHHLQQQQGYIYAIMNDKNNQQQYTNVYGNIHGDDNGFDSTDTDYVRMMRDSRTYQHIAPNDGNASGPVMIVKKDSSKKIRKSNSKKSNDYTPSYLEITK